MIRLQYVLDICDYIIMVYLANGSRKFDQLRTTLKRRMTQAKLTASSSTEVKSENNKCTENVNSKGQQKPLYLRDGCVQATAWILLTLGLCIIVITFYLAIRENRDKEHGDGNSMVYGDYEDNEHTMANIDYANIESDFNKKEERLRGMDYDDAKPLKPDLRGCREKFCKIHCRQAENINEEILQLLNRSPCLFVDMLLIENQHFPAGLLKNNWIAADNITVRECLLISSHIRRIHNGAFNTPMFSDTFLLSWRKLNLTRVDSGALLGLHSLKNLVVDTRIPSLDRAFFQPVQTTLTTLKLYADLTFSKDYNIFGISQLSSLEYADLSYNNFNGPITQDMLLAAPNLKYLIITHAKITCIERNAFQQHVGKLQLLNLSNNLFTTINAEVFVPLLVTKPRTYINLAINSWNCNCKLYDFALCYSRHRSQFMDTLYCKAPHSLYGTALNEVSFAYCNASTNSNTSTIGNIEELYELHSTTPTSIPSTIAPNILPTTTLKPFLSGTSSPLVIDTNHTVADDRKENENVDGEEEEDENTETETDTKVFQLRCLNSVDTNVPDTGNEEGSAEIALAIAQSDSSLSFDRSALSDSLIDSSQSAADSLVIEVNPKAIDASNTEEIDYFEFDPPTNDFELRLLGNHSVQVVVSDYATPINIIWFTEDLQSTQLEDAGTSQSYNCMQYFPDFLIVDDVMDNSTYTFCLMRENDKTITPFNCLPLHIPAAVPNENNVWISQDEKAFTIGILCLIFSLSIFFGAVIAYFGVKTYPDLLEGSKNVLVVKKPEPNCYVSTITETEYMKQSSFKKKAQSSSVKKKPLPETSTPAIQAPFSISTQHLDRLSSLKSSSTYFEDAFAPTFFSEDEYEMPKHCAPDYYYQERCVPNTYATSPSLPPPLPKRNSSVADTVVINRFGQED